MVLKENRPFSVQNIVDALQKEGVKKTAVERSLATLVETGKVKKKEYGKAKIFLLAQDQLELPDAKDMASTDAEMRTLSQRLTQVNSNIDEKRERVAQLKSQYTLEGATQLISKLEDELTLKMAKRERLGDGSALMSKEEKAGIEKAYYDVRSLWKKYHVLVKSIVDQIGEATGKKRSELYEEIGIETDEEAKVDIADFPEIENPLKAKRGVAQGRSASAKRFRQL